MVFHKTASIYTVYIIFQYTVYIHGKLLIYVVRIVEVSAIYHIVGSATRRWFNMMIGSKCPVVPGFENFINVFLFCIKWYDTI